MQASYLGSRTQRVVAQLQRVLWWVFALTAAYAVASDPERLFAIVPR